MLRGDALSTIKKGVKMGQREEDVVAVIVTFNPNVDTLYQLLSALRSQVGAMVIVDNHSEAMGKSIPFHLEGLPFEWISLNANRGVAVGHNTGIEWARRRGARYVLLMDQDSIPGTGMVRELMVVHEQLSHDGKFIAGVGCRFSGGSQENFSGFVQVGFLGFKHVVGSELTRYVEADFLISSGTLISLSVIDVVGAMEEGLFIDHVDTEWFLRARAKGYIAYGATRAVMHHSIGERRSRLWFLRWRAVSHHAPIRYYYMFRNSMLLLRRDYATKRWRRGLVLKLAMTALFFSCTNAGWDNIRMMGRGLRDGLRDVYGPYAG